MSRKARRIQPGDAANIFIRCLLSEAGELLGGLNEQQWKDTCNFFKSRCAYTGKRLKPEAAARDHAIPINKEHCGLHLYGNVVPTSTKVNQEKHHKHFRKFVTDSGRLKKIEAFLKVTRYKERVAMLGDLTNYCETQYEIITSLCQANRSYLERRLENMERKQEKTSMDRAPRLNSPGLSHKPSQRANTLPITLDPSPASEFKKAFLKVGQALIIIDHTDGHKEEKLWTRKSNGFAEKSSVLGNLRSRREFRQGEWQKRGIVRVHVVMKWPQKRKSE
ncbi:MAG: hypothetical protein HY611_01465 [Elusimicrobia bacterium]|nr:hypothetical protein [Elusimicrobiota bacterium]